MKVGNRVRLFGTAEVGQKNVLPLFENQEEAGDELEGGAAVAPPLEIGKFWGKATVVVVVVAAETFISPSEGPSPSTLLPLLGLFG